VDLSGISVGKDILYSCDANGKRIRSHRLDESLTVLQEFPSPGQNPTGVAWDGQNLWTCDAGVARVYQHVPDERLTVLASYPTIGKNPVGLYHDGEFLWSGDADTRKLYKHNIDRSLSVREIYALPSQEVPAFSGFAIVGDEVWVSNEEQNYLLRYRLSSLKE